jgi:hypothetical protein
MVHSQFKRLSLQQTFMLHEYRRIRMYASRLRIAALAAVAAAGLAACTTPYGYGGVSMGVGNGYYGSSYGGYGYGYPDYGYGGYGYPASGYGYAPYSGWYNDFYYPGTGYYVYDRDHHRHRWTDDQRRYWNDVRQRSISSREFRDRMVALQNQTSVEQNAVSAQRVQGGSSPQRLERVSRPFGAKPASRQRCASSAARKPARRRASSGPSVPTAAQRTATTRLRPAAVALGRST